MSEEILLVNKMENVVSELADEMLANNNPTCCKCERCRMDIMALALNKLPPRYVVTEIGNAVTSVSLNSSQWRAEVTVALYAAIEIVNQRPRH